MVVLTPPHTTNVYTSVYHLKLSVSYVRDHECECMDFKLLSSRDVINCFITFTYVYIYFYDDFLFLEVSTGRSFLGIDDHSLDLLKIEPFEEPRTNNVYDIGITLIRRLYYIYIVITHS